MMVEAVACSIVLLLVAVVVAIIVVIVLVQYEYGTTESRMRWTDLGPLGLTELLRRDSRRNHFSTYLVLVLVDIRNSPPYEYSSDYSYSTRSPHSPGGQQTCTILPYEYEYQRTGIVIFDLPYPMY